MPLSRLRSALLLKHTIADTGQHLSSRAPAKSLMATQSALSPQSWSSTHADFKSLRFVVWTRGDPGFTLTIARPSESGTYSVDFDEDVELRVDTVTAPKVWEAGVRPGDILETVSGKRVHTMDTEAALVLVRMSKSPSVIRFRSPTSGTRKRFDVVLRGQKLGVFFTGDGRHEIPVVTRIGSRSSSQDSDRDATSSFNEVRPGDVLVAINGKDAIAAGLHMTSEYLETCPRPLKLTFERITNSEWFVHQATSEESVQHQKAYSTLHQTISSAAVSALAARETASLRCKAFFKTLMPKNVLSPLSPVNRGAGHRSRNFGRVRDNVVIEWESGPLGLTLLEDAISGVPIVNRLTGKGLSANMERLHHGFLLYSINGVQVEACSLKDLYRDMLALPKPVTLIFCPPLFNGTSDESSESQCSARSLSSSTSPDISGTKEIEFSQHAHQALAAASAAQYRCPEQSSSVHDKNEYEVVWTSARLGLKLDMPPDRKQKLAKKNKVGSMSTRRRYPIVHEVLQDSTLGLPSDAVGHLFVSINNWHTFGLTAEELRTILGAASKPAVLRFRRPDARLGFQPAPLPTFYTTTTDDGSMDYTEATLESTYSILWSEGKLGIVFGCYEEAASHNALVVYVKSIGPGQAQKSKLVRVGDILYSIDGRDLPPKQNFKKAMRVLITSSSSRPVTLGFRRMPWSTRSTGRSAFEEPWTRTLEQAMEEEVRQEDGPA